MTNKEKYKRAFSVLHASDDTMQEVLEMQNGNGKRYKAVHNTLRRGAVIAIAAALAALLGVTAYAVSTSDFFQSAFGSNISTEPAEIYSNSGEKIDLPEEERVEVDDETAQALVGDYVISVGQSFSSPYALTGEVVFTIDSFLMDENGTGVMTYTVTVDGHAPHYENAGYGEVYGGPELEIWPSEDSTEDTGGVWPYTYLDEELSNDSEAHLVAYFGTPGEADYTDTSLYIARLYTTVVGEDEYHSGEEVVNYDGITIQLGELLPAVTLTAENGDTMSVSSVGMRIDCGNVVKNFVDEYADADTITIHYADGTEYVVRSDEYDNTTGDMVNEDCTRNCCIFNRLVDTESIESVSVIFDGADDSTQEVIYS